MPSQRNIQLLQKTKEKVQKAVALFFVDYQGLTHKQLEEARALLKETSSEVSIVKNTLMNRALVEKKVEVRERLHGPFATLFSYGDPLAAAKALHAFFKKYNYLPKIKFGIFENRIIEEGDISQLATLPSREVLLGKLLGLLKSPMSNLVYSLNWNVQKLVLVLKEIEKRKSASSQPA